MRTTFAVLGAFVVVVLIAVWVFEPRVAEPETRIRAERQPVVLAPVGFVDFEAEYAAQQERVAVYLAAVEAERVAAYLEAMRPKIEVDWARWERLHVCEQPGNWYANGRNPADGARQVFQGGLGMSTGAWQMAVRAAQARGVALPGSALAASPEEQMTGAQAFYDAHGWGWACRV